MGLRRAYVDFIQRSVAATLGGLEGTKMLELGNQRFSRSEWMGARTGKAYFTKRGVEHISLDFNGKDGAVALDLSASIDKPEWNNHFDIITNSGTTEHVEPLSAQFSCFENLHRWLKPGGISIHIVPAIEELERNGRWRNHCNNYYSAAFFEMLAHENGYDLVESTVINDLRSACLRKRHDTRFMTDRGVFEGCITRKEGGIDYAGRHGSLWSRMQRIIGLHRRDHEDQS